MDYSKSKEMTRKARKSAMYNVIKGKGSCIYLLNESDRNSDFSQSHNMEGMSR